MSGMQDTKVLNKITLNHVVNLMALFEGYCEVMGLSVLS